jgi:uncharacterized protein (DUF1800 family)
MRDAHAFYRKIQTATLGLILLSSSAGAISLEEARQLLNRSGFGASPAEVNFLLPKTYEQAVDQLLDEAVQHRGAQVAPPSWVFEPALPDQKPKDMAPDEKMAFENNLRDERMQLKGWWYQQMIMTPSPLAEHMTLFWHNHFTSAFDKVRWPVYMYRQNILLRQDALGNFRDLLTAIAKDPAMVLYLDTQSNHKGQPNENFARELMELFTLGEGHYSEKDIQEAARAFTGWQVDMKTGTFVVRPRQHDDGEKQFLGHTGYFTGDDILSIILEQPRTAEFITEKLWREFISPDPDPAEVKRLAAIFRSGNYEIRPLIRALFLSPAFRDPKNRGVLTKSPVDLIVGTIRTFQVPIDDVQPLVVAGRSMGMDIFDPPNVKGWPGGQSWISTYTLLTRRQFLARLLRGREMTSSKTAMKASQDNLNGIDFNEWMGQADWKDSADISTMTAILLPIPPVDAGSPQEDVARQLRELVLDPAYQLK